MLRSVAAVGGAIRPPTVTESGFPRNLLRVGNFLVFLSMR
jgi:hypothetical protein